MSGDIPYIYIYYGITFSIPRNRSPALGYIIVIGTALATYILCAPYYNSRLISRFCVEVDRARINYLRLSFSDISVLVTALVTYQF